MMHTNRLNNFQWVWMMVAWLASAFALASCHSHERGSSPAGEGTWWTPLENHYARGFSYGYFSEFKILEVHNPWQGGRHREFTYILVPRNRPVHDSLKAYGRVIRVPVERVICTSTTHIAFLDALDQLSTVVGISGAHLITNETIRERLLDGFIADIGYDRNLNFETLIAGKPQMVMTYGIENEIAGFINRMDQLDIPVVINGEYLEEAPLGKLEWIKFVAAFYNMEETANAWFDSIRHQYEDLVLRTRDVEQRPVVMTGLPWKDIWYISGANSTIANFIEDAGGQYIWDQLESDRAVPMDVEMVFDKAASAAGIWINTGTASSIKDILQMDERFGHFMPIRSGMVFNNNARTSRNGGNDYWESGIIFPDRILKDLISIFHPHLLEGHELYYYTKLE
jgi:iron complex transport system substrate-binding protein